jgi:hypothetical protein
MEQRSSMDSRFGWDHDGASKDIIPSDEEQIYGVNLVFSLWKYLIFSQLGGELKIVCESKAKGERMTLSPFNSG